MAATGIFAEAIAAVSADLTGLGYKVVTDPRNARPLTVFLELPTMDAFTYNVGDIRIRARILAPPPGNQDATDWLITQVDTIMASDIAVTNGSPGYASYGGQEIPTYDLTIAVAVRRN
jgi:hypothetical protein